jgi:drug/metabolite transporter (DMT)-like permease
MDNKAFRVYASAIFAMIFWAFSFIWYKEVLVLYRPISLVLMRLIISSIFLFVVTLSIGKLNKLYWSDLKLFLPLTFFQPFLYFLGESYGVNLVPSTVAAVIISTIPLLSPIGAYYILKEKISLMNFFGIIVSFSGVAVVIFHQGFNLVDLHPVGVAFLFLAVAAAIGYSLLIKRLSTRYNVFSIVAYQNTLGILFFLPLFFILDFNEFITITPTRDVIIPLFKLGIFASTFAFVFFTYAIKHLGVTRANIFTNTIPVLTAIFAYFLLDETITYIKMLGIVIVVSGLFLSQIRKGMFVWAVKKA